MAPQHPSKTHTPHAESPAWALLGFFDQVGVGLYRSTPDGRLITVNDALARMLGFDDAAELMERGVDDGSYAPETPRELFVEAIERDGFVRNSLARWRHQNGGWIDVRESARSVRDEHGTTLYYEGYVEDVSAQRAAEDAVRASEAQLRGLLDNTSVGFYRTTPQGRVLFVNDAMARILGYPSVDAVLQVNVENEYAGVENSRAAWTARIERDGEIRGLVTDWKRADGSPVRVREDARRVTGPGGDTLYYEGTVVDLTDLAKAEAALDERESQIRTLIEKSPIGIGIDSPGQGFTRVNPAMCRLLGYGEQELLGKSAKDLSFEEDLGEVLPLVEALHRGERDAIFLERRYRRKDGAEIWCLTSVVAVRKDGAWTYSIVMLDDITERKQLEQSARTVQKLEAVGRLAGGISHDFNNMLTAITGHASFAQRALPPDSPALPELVAIRAACERAAALTRQLLTFSRGRPSQAAPFDAGQVVRELETMLRRVIGEDVRMQSTVGAGPHVIRADRTQIEQVIMNLVVNARDAMPAGGDLVIALDAVEVRETYAAALDVQPGPFIRLRVQDTGTGMDEATRARLFEPFFTTKAAGHGTGLGLATLYGIVRQAGGGVRVDSTPGLGTTFDVFLPQCIEGTQAGAQMRRRTPPPGLGNERILVVEDQDAIRRLLERALRDAGYRVITMANGAEAMAHLQTAEQPPHLLLTDVLMPGMEGTTLAAAARERHPELPVLFVSGYLGDPAVAERVQRSGLPLLPKPFAPDELTATVRKCLDGLL